MIRNTTWNKCLITMAAKYLVGMGGVVPSVVFMKTRTQVRRSIWSSRNSNVLLVELKGMSMISSGKRRG